MNLILCFLASVVLSRAERTTEYTITLDAPQTQMVGISMTVRDVSVPELVVSLPTWRPGRYSILDPAGTLRGMQAFNGGGASLPIEKVDKSTWRVTTLGADEVRLEYVLYANSIFDRTRHVDDTHAFLSGASVFCYAPDRRADPVVVTVKAPFDWSIASGLEPHPERPNTVVAGNYDVLVDSPLEIGLHDRWQFQVDGVPHEIVIWPPDAADYDAEKLTEDFAAIVEEEAKLFGGMPYQRYVFLMHVGAGAGGGTEHLNSTIMQTSRRALEEPEAYRRFLGLVSHEMYHTWNVKQFRPAGIQPYDYQRENYTKLLWVVEGTTSYYDDLVLVRTGLIKPRRYLEVLSGNIDSQRRRPGARVQSLEASSFDAWIKFTRSTPDDPNSTISFYSKGALVSLLLDLEIRKRSDHDASLDDVMRDLYEHYPVGGRGYTPGDFKQLVEDHAGSPMNDFFDRYVSGTDVLPLEDLFDVVGLELYFKPAKRDTGVSGDDEDDDDDDDDESHDDDEPHTPTHAYLGLRTREQNGHAVVRSVLSDGPAYTAGLIAGDELIALGDRKIPAGGIDKLLDSFEPGDEITLSVFRRDRLRSFTITLGDKPDGKWALRRVKEPTDLQKAAYETWIGQSWPE